MVTNWFLLLFFYGMQENDIPDDLQKVADRIRELRIQKGYSNYESFAFTHNIPRAQYGRYEKGTDLRLSSLLKVIKALGVTPEEFFRGM